MSEPITMPATTIDWPPPPSTKWEREYAAFQRLLPGLLATLRVLNPGAALFGAILGSPAALPAASGSAGHPLRAVQLALPPAVDWTAFTVWLSALLHARGDDVIRVKGIIRTPAGRLLLQSVRKSVQQPEILPEQHGDDEQHDNLVAFIGRGFAAATLQRSLRVFVGH